MINAEEEIFEMNNGCICCTVRGDLIRILGKSDARRDKFDRIVLETTGLANPGPVAQTFFVDDGVREEFVLDGIVTMVDARYFDRQLEESEETRTQVAFADVIVLNKTDLVGGAHLDALEHRVRAINALARIVRSDPAQHASVPMADVLGIGGFDLARALEYKPTFLDPEYPFEWAGAYDLTSGDYTLTLEEGPDPTMNIAVVESLVCKDLDPASAAERVFPLFSGAVEPAAPGAVIEPQFRALRLEPAESERTEDGEHGAQSRRTSFTLRTLLTSLGGTTFPWSSGAIIGLGIGAVAAVVGFVLVERRAAEPVLPLYLFANRVFSAASGVGLVVGFAMFGTLWAAPRAEPALPSIYATSRPV